MLGALLVATGCKSTNVPSGIGWKSLSATQVLGIAILDSTKGLDLDDTAGKTVVVRSKGFEKDEVGSYFRLVIEELIYEAGGVVRSDGELVAEVHVHLSGIEQIERFFIPIFDTTRLVSRINGELVIRDRSGTLISRQSLSGAAMYKETAILLVFTTPGAYFVERGNVWEELKSNAWITDELYWEFQRWLKAEPKNQGGQRVPLSGDTD
jgi:hypothetical protein